jgi:hypothetical protein
VDGINLRAQIGYDVCTLLSEADSVTPALSTCSASNESNLAFTRAAMGSFLRRDWASSAWFHPRLRLRKRGNRPARPRLTNFRVQGWKGVIGANLTGAWHKGAREYPIG